MEHTPRCILCDSPSTVFGVKNGHTLYTCSKCDFTFVYPVPDAAEVYNEGYFTGESECTGYANYDVDKEPMVPTFKEYLKRIKALAPGKRLLDVGAATGFFLEIARNEGYEVRGVEISAYASVCAREKGIDVTAGTLKDIPSSASFDVITMFDVIEHVSNPVE